MNASSPALIRARGDERIIAGVDSYPLHEDPSSTRIAA
jgi:hypothetical protein